MTLRPNERDCFGEVADLCYLAPDYVANDGGFYAARVWSNSAASLGTGSPCIPVPAGEVYQCVESPRGEIGYYIVSDGTSKPYRVHMRTPSFANLQALPTMLKGELIADSIAALGSMDFVLGDTDR